MRLVAGALIAKTVWISRDALRRGAYEGATLGWVEAGTAAIGLFAEAGAAPAFSPISERPMANYSIGINAGVAFVMPNRASSIAASLSLLVASITSAAINRAGRTEPLAAFVPEALSYIPSALPTRVLAEQLRHQAGELDAARAEAIVQAERLAAEGERRRQYRVLHDSALQVLEAVAGGWPIDDDVLLARIDFEAERLEQLLSPEPDVQLLSLDEALAHLVSDRAAPGLAVALVTDLRQPVGGLIAQALSEAAHEALTNVGKHAGTDHATITARTVSDGIEVVVADHGCGFDVTAPRTGFGLSQSIEARLGEIAGTARIESVPGQGTRVTLWAPT